MTVLTRLDLRLLGSGDLEQVVALERAVYERPPATAAGLADDLARPRSGEGACCNVGGFGRTSGELVAMARAIEIAGPWHVVDVATHPKWRRQGAGSLLLGSLLRNLHGVDGHGLTLEVRVSNDAAITMYRAHDFRELGRRTRYYDAPVEDAIVMWRAPSAVIEAGGAATWKPVL